MRRTVLTALGTTVLLGALAAPCHAADDGTGAPGGVVATANNLVEDTLSVVNNTGENALTVGSQTVDKL
ncbi:hypothetical protein ACQEVS_29380 [Streptomyces sp. CA-181903]|uniref:hypothetical protein n=1 Tax=Streptomyces sp. CA-181903 TaxID=3240055 RepID=UPI003D8B9928